VDDAPYKKKNPYMFEYFNASSSGSNLGIIELHEDDALRYRNM